MRTAFYNRINIAMVTTMSVIAISRVKGLVHTKMKISLCFTHPRGILGVYDFLLSDESNLGVLLKIVLAIPSVIIAVGGCFCSTVQKT